MRTILTAVATAIVVVLSSGALAQSVPGTYHAVRNRNVYPKPAVPSLGPAGSRITDPSFGSRILRVTDQNTDTRPGQTGASYSTPSAAHQLAWNAASDRFYVRSLSGWYFAFAFDAATMTASRIELPTYNGLLDTHIEPQFSFRLRNILYAGTRDQRYPTHDYPLVHEYDFNTGRYEILLPLTDVTTVPPDTYVGGISSSAAAPEKIAVMFGGQQDTHFKVAVFQRDAPLATVAILDTKASTLNGGAVVLSTGVPLDFNLHHTWIDLSGRYVVLYPVSGLPVQYVVWDLTTNVFTPVTTRAFGHDALGYGLQVNQDCCTSGAPYDGSQWQLRSLATPATTSDLINPMLSPRQIYIADHTSWNNAQPSRRVPILSSSYRYYNGTYNTTPWRAWDDEIVAIQTDATSGATVWRFAHHRSNVSRDDTIDGTYFWYQPRGVISPNGRWALFTSNWEKTLGAMPVPDWGASFRTDVFVVSLAAGRLTSAAPAGGATPIRAVHLLELRERVDVQRAVWGLAPFAWTDPAPTAGAPVRAVHLTELRTALQEAYQRAGRHLPGLTDAFVTPGVIVIGAAHIQQLQDAVAALEGG